MLGRRETGLIPKNPYAMTLTKFKPPESIVGKLCRQNETDHTHPLLYPSTDKRACVLPRQ
jgi:hypothetical protein